MQRIAMVLFAALAGSAHADGFGFETPSGNIYCNGHLQGGAVVSCSIVVRNGPVARPKPASCAGTWGHSFTVSETGPARMECLGKPPRRVGYTDKAPYGVTGEFGRITCQSERTGFQCRNASGHGFFLSRRKQTLF
ncbi:hypothetical protein CLV78_102621 [Aliiruegeria haliotis]|uniref:CVNH domain-containing protein n=1 Tax=Aliiruegeria haliotis TaxID=1280846 RepID=A0A2T0RWD9_9RHOB|nr:DUF6636 domain-containing protein [Aliiruegeria haliotis]PRY25442.1 hypothetical protein CLV78_102621 [Aliiruegeria haliotis]